MAATKPNKNIRSHLTLATCSLLTPQAAQAQESYENDWVGDVAFLTYQESDDRITVNKLIAEVTGQISDNDKIDMMLVIDSMTGATPTGGLPSGNGSFQSVSGTSGGGFNTAGEPLALAPFDDTRLAVKIDWTHDYNRTFRMTYGGSISVENDYNSFGGNVTLEKDSTSKLSTYSAGFAFTSDRVGQLGGDTPDPLSETEDQRFFGEGERTTLDLIFGVTRIINARTLLQVNTSFNTSSGYHTDPYKVFSIADQDDNEQERRYESRPDERKRNTLYAKLVQQLNNENNLHLSYRYYTDDWDIDSHTIGGHYRINLNKHNTFLIPHLRLYAQSAANFYYRTLPIGTPIPTYISADNRLGKMNSYTIGVRYGFPLSDGGTMRLRLDFMDQSFDDAIFEDNKAIIFQISFKKDFN